MHPDLEKFLLAVWGRATKRGGTFEKIVREKSVATRHRLPTIDAPKHEVPGTAEVVQRMVYAVYNQVSTSAPGLQQEGVSGWLKKAAQLGEKMKMLLQIGGKFHAFGPIYTAFLAGHAREEQTAALSSGFIHYCNESCPHTTANVRVYINPVPGHALHLLEYLLERLTGEVELNYGRAPRESSPLSNASREGRSEGMDARATEFSSCKISGPLSLGKRSDGILVYCANRWIANAVVAILGNADPGWFSPETPRLTEKVDDMELRGVGISLAEEPPEVAVGIRNSDQQSFGSLRSEIIAAALLESAFNEELGARSLHDFMRFCHAVEAGFRGYGLDPNSPSLNL